MSLLCTHPAGTYQCTPGSEHNDGDTVSRETGIERVVSIIQAKDSRMRVDHHRGRDVTLFKYRIGGAR